LGSRADRLLEWAQISFGSASSAPIQTADGLRGVILPAAAAVAEIELVAVATTRQESAAAARDRYGAARAFADAGELIAHPDVEAVSVAVKVPEHFELVRAALEAGKHVYCEWPLGANTDEARQLQELAAGLGLHTIVGLQTGRSVAVRRVRELVSSGAIGRLLSATVSDKSAFGGAQLEAARIWTADSANGVSIFTISVGHGLDILNRVAAPFRELSATLATRYPQATVVETGELVQITIPDQVAIEGVLTDGSVVTAHFRGGLPYGNGFRLDLHRTEGSLHFPPRRPFTTRRPPLSTSTAMASGPRSRFRPAIPVSPTVPRRSSHSSNSTSPPQSAPARQSARTSPTP
jgi:predicted dehydrogenase